MIAIHFTRYYTNDEAESIESISMYYFLDLHHVDRNDNHDRSNCW